MSDKKGFTLTELLIAIGIASIVGLVSFQVISMLMQESSKLRSKLGQISLQKDLQTALRKKQTCQISMQNRPFQASEQNPITIALDNQIQVGVAGAQQNIKAYDLTVNSLNAVVSNTIATVGVDALYNVRIILDSQPLGATGSFAAVPIATMRLHVRSGQIVNCEMVAEVSDVAQVTCDSLSGTVIDGACHVSPNIEQIGCKSSDYMQGFDTTGKTVCQTIPTKPAPTPPPPPPPPPDQLWTWQGLLYQTTCPSLCDGVEWASCVGPACGGSKIQCYTASPWGVPGHAAGSTQTTQPTSFFCMFY